MIRTFFQSDIDQVLQIEQSAHVTPWTREIFKGCFHAGYTGWVVEVDKKVIGFILISLGVDECHILNLCVLRASQRQGWGKMLLEHALQHAIERGMVMAWLEVRRSNSRAITLYQKMHFHLAGERKGYYSTVSGDEDALVFAIDLHQR